eukprot:NODE_2043_length_1151_cov_163.349609_g2026_i0.p1 GENE.NODE_2043_length_1151_cov_163.349609_g2026_i0~~NODE_2043_length_1151_cov_163.349609_g2026_i0.p1  ORF type:complete len:337 (+),score=63.99 NODE_2043_length_1151_cov_163.349609_g2026_i0:22-1011(+)
MDASDIFSQMFGGGGGMFGGMGGMFGGGGGRRGPSKGKDVAHAMPVALEDLYKGKTKKLSLNKQVLCGQCKGTGSKSGKSTTCSACKGQGVRVILRQLGPGMVQQMQVRCDQCKQTGKTVSEADKCSPCGGDGVTTEKKLLEVQITPGMEHGEKIVFSQEGDQSPEYKIPGDVVIVLQEKKHEKFTRQKQDLLISRTITLKEALCGLSFPLQHLDGRTLLVKLAEGDLVKPGSVKCVQNEGMPHKRNPFSKGNLLIKFEVEMPEGLSEKALDTLRKVLPGPKEEPADMDNAEECFMRDVNMGSYNTERAHQEDSDDEDGGGQRAQCVHQ